MQTKGNPMSEDNKTIDLSSNNVDAAAAAARGVLGMIPIVGGLLAELVSAYIPQQRMERVAKYLNMLDERVERLGRDVAESRLKQPAYEELFEDGLFQAARATSDERKEHIAALVANGLNAKETQQQGFKHLLQLLGEMNEVELLVLISHGFPQTYATDTDFQEKHALALDIPVRYYGSEREDLDKVAIAESYRQHLVRLGLLKVRRADPRERVALTSYELSDLGYALIRQLDIKDLDGFLN